MATNSRKGIQPVPDALRRMDDGGFLDQIRKEMLAVQQALTASGIGSTGVAASPSPTPGPPGPPGPPAPAPAPSTPDLTPPPTPSGVVVSAGLDFIFITTDAPTFSQGHGYARTIVYGTTYGGSGPLPTFSDAVRTHEFVGQVGSFAAEMGVQWHIWLKWLTNDGVESVSPSGGANGHQATTALLGNVHLGPLIVEAGNLADGSVTATKVADASLGMTKFAAGIRPPRVLGALPTLPAAGYLDGDTAILTTDGKLYRIVLGAWTRAVDGADLIANSITAGAIAAGAIGATQIAANAITTDKLLVTGRGAALNADPTARDPSAWTNLAGTPATFVTNVVDAPFGGSTALQSVSASASRPFSAELIPIDSAKNYRMEAWFKLVSGASAPCYFAIAWYDAAGTYLQSNVAQPTGAGSPAGWTANGVYSYGGLVNATPPGTWSRYVYAFGPDETAKIPSNARFVRIGALLNNTAQVAVVQMSGIRLMEKAAADLIVDGAIVANKLAANAIAVGTAAIQNGAIINAMIADATITNAKIVSLAASKILAGSIAVGEYIQSSDFETGERGWRMGGNMAEIGAAYIRGQLTASQINGNGLVLRDNSGVPILGVNNPLSASYISALVGGGNILPNSSFELDTNGDGTPDYWTNSSFGTNITIGLSQVAGGIDGASALRLTVSSITSPTSQVTHQVVQTAANASPVIAGQRYIGSIWAQTSTLAYTAVVTVQWFDASAASLGTDNVAASYVFSATNTWERIVSPQLTAPTGAVSARMRFGIRRSATTDTTLGNMTFDAVQLEPGELATGYLPSHKDKTGLDNPITSGNISTYIASAAIGDAYIADLNAAKITAGTLNAARIGAGSITTDKILVGAASAASSGDTGALSQSFTSTFAWQSTITTVTSLVTTGSPVKVLGDCDVDVVFNSASVAAVSVSVGVYDGAVLISSLSNKFTVPTLGATARGGSAQRQAQIHIPLVARYTPSAGTHNYRFRVTVEGLDSSGNVLSTSGDLFSRAFLIAEENKV